MNTICETKLAELELDRYGLLVRGTEKSISCSVLAFSVLFIILETCV